MVEPARVTAYECKSKQAEIFRRAVAGETIIVTKNGVPIVEIRKARNADSMVADAVQALAELQSTQLADGLGGGAAELRRIQEEGRS